MPEELVKRHGSAPGERRGGRGKRSASRAIEIADQLGVDPLKWMLNLLKNGTYQAVVIDEAGKKKRITKVAPLELLLDCARTCTSYIHPKLSSTTVSGHVEKTDTFNLNVMEILAGDPARVAELQSLALYLADSQAGEPAQLGPGSYPGLREADK